ncbi:MAG: hypothetical protein LBS61_00695 [Endomicrobium sp.]|jgi:ABC-type polysaccharide transport system permease subunit|nr:hypothetical protein [Endomicrobium sp.]
MLYEKSFKFISRFKTSLFTPMKGFCQNLEDEQRQRTIAETLLGGTAGIVTGTVTGILTGILLVSLGIYTYEKFYQFTLFHHF